MHVKKVAYGIIRKASKDIAQMTTEQIERKEAFKKEWDRWGKRPKT